MRRFAPLIVVLVLVACGGDAESPPGAGPDTTVQPTPRTVRGVSPEWIVRSQAAARSGALLETPALAPLDSSAADLLAQARSRARAPAAPTEDEAAWIALVRTVLTQAGVEASEVHGGGLDLDVGTKPCRLLQAQAAGARFLRLVGGGAAEAKQCFDERFEPWEAAGYHVRPADGPGERAVRTNLYDAEKSALVWQVGRVVVELEEPDGRTVRRVHTAALEAGLYADDLPRKESLGVEGISDAPFGLGEEKVRPKKDSPPSPVPSQPDRKVRGMRFFEGGKQAPSPEARAYRAAFARAETRYVWWELVLSFRSSRQVRTFDIDATWRTSDGALIGTHTESVRVGAGERIARPCKGWGRAEAGSWAPGLYRVDLSMGKEAVASGVFRVTGPPAGTAEIGGVRLMHNQVVGGERGMKIVYDLVVNGRLGVDTHVGVYPRMADGKPLRDFDGSYRTGDGEVATHANLRPAYPSARWKQAEIFFPYTQLHLVKGKHDLKLELRVYDPPTNVALARSTWVTFTMTIE